MLSSQVADISASCSVLLSRIFLVVLLVLSATVVATSQNVTKVIAENTQTITGVLTISYPMGHPAGYHLMTESGESILLIPSPAAEGDLYRYNRATIEVTGNLVGETLYMEKWAPAGVSAAGFPPPVSGPQNTLIILFQTSDKPGTNTVAHFQDVLTGPSLSMNAYFVEDSYNIITVTGSPTAQWYTLPHPSTYYNVQNWGNCKYQTPTPSYTDLATDIVSVVDADVHFENYIPNGHIYFVSSDAWVWGCSLSWGGGGIPTADGVSITHAPFVSEGDPLSTYLHEFSHDLGLPDLYDYTAPVDPYQFIDGWDLMSMDHAQHHSSWSKMYLGWIPSSEITSFTGPISVTATIDGIESPTSGLHTLKIQTPGMPATSYFLVEARQKVGFDVPSGIPPATVWGIPANAPDHGVLITKIDETAGGGAGIVREVDQNPATQSPSDGDALWQVGQTYVDGTYPFSVAIQSWTGTGFVITVSTNALYQVSFTQTGSAVAPTVQYHIDSGSDTPGTVPFAVWVEVGHSISYTYQSPVPGAAGVQYVLTGVIPASPQTVNGPLTINGNYKTQYSLTTGVAYGGGSVSPNCPSGCWTDQGSPVSVAATPDPGWAFSSWTITGAGASCSGGVTSNPCNFNMPSNAVSVFATFQPQLVVTLVSPPSPPNGRTVAPLVPLRVHVTGPGGLPVSGATVTIYVNGAPTTCSGMTDSKGNFSCIYRGLMPRTYTWYATASKSGSASGTSPTWTFKTNW